MQCQHGTFCRMLAGAFRTVYAQLLDCLAAAAAGGTLQQLAVEWASFSPLQLGACLTGATRLRSLAVSAYRKDGLRLTPSSLTGLPSLESLDLAGTVFGLYGRHRVLPASLTRLVLQLVDDSRDNCLPAQVGAAGRAIHPCRCVQPCCCGRELEATCYSTALRRALYPRCCTALQ